MSSYNRITLVGNLVNDPEIKKEGKQSRADFTLEVERYLGKDKKPTVDFFNVVCLGKLAEVCGSFLNKGKKVLVDGRLQMRPYMKDEERRWIKEIVAEKLEFLSPTPAETNITEAATLLGRKGGLVKSKAKASASAENGKKGGRPRKEM